MLYYHKYNLENLTPHQRIIMRFGMEHNVDSVTMFQAASEAGITPELVTFKDEKELMAAEAKFSQSNSSEKAAFFFIKKE